MTKGEMRWSKEVAGDDGNYDWPVTFDVTDGYIGITQEHGKERPIERVLLSPAQVRALLAFVGATKPTSMRAPRNTARSVAASRSTLPRTLDELTQ